MAAMQHNECPGKRLLGPLTSVMDGTPGAIRTRDLRFRKPLLYPLSYRGLLCWDSQFYHARRGLVPGAPEFHVPHRLAAR